MYEKDDGKTGEKGIEQDWIRGVHDVNSAFRDIYEKTLLFIYF